MSQDDIRGLSDAPGGPEGVVPSNGSLKDRLRLVEPRSTYVILCWDEGRFRAMVRQARPDAILGPFTEREATRVAQTLTCECEMTNIDTQPPDWATA